MIFRVNVWRLIFSTIVILGLPELVLSDTGRSSLLRHATWDEEPPPVLCVWTGTRNLCMNLADLESQAKLTYSKELVGAVLEQVEEVMEAKGISGGGAHAYTALFTCGDRNYQEISIERDRHSFSRSWFAPTIRPKEDNALQDDCTERLNEAYGNTGAKSFIQALLSEPLGGNSGFTQEDVDSTIDRMDETIAQCKQSEIGEGLQSKVTDEIAKDVADMILLMDAEIYAAATGSGPAMAAVLLGGAAAAAMDYYLAKRKTAAQEKSNKLELKLKQEKEKLAAAVKKDQEAAKKKKAEEEAKKKAQKEKERKQSDKEKTKNKKKTKEEKGDQKLGCVDEQCSSSCEEQENYFKFMKESCEKTDWETPDCINLIKMMHPELFVLCPDPRRALTDPGSQGNGCFRRPSKEELAEIAHQMRCEEQSKVSFLSLPGGDENESCAEFKSKEEMFNDWKEIQEKMVCLYAYGAHADPEFGPQACGYGY